MKCQVLFSLKINVKKIRMLSAIILLSALRVFYWGTGDLDI